MKVGTIGAGAVALAFAREARAAGYEVVLSSAFGDKWLQPPGREYRCAG
jgi:hypothetical protein